MYVLVEHCNAIFPFLMKNIQGVVIKEGQVIGYLDQFGNELPIKVFLLLLYWSLAYKKLSLFTYHAYLIFFMQSDVAGEVLKIMFKDGGNIYMFN